ncbi:MULTISPECIES: 4a-hydroxytetrahydrobiopterin dehydratase [Marinomonas]|uniref:4a-hydroxytetrahydrobiopterin dehydratase n=1 Tax=Marinomonas TaxID=28253 RepID=UPI001056AB15|nr:4a-hydroxytetrahydrobiopterin dehydratase [Marinomonas flavescens]
MSLKALSQEEIEWSLKELNKSTDGRWVVKDGKLSRSYTFRNFQQAFGFMTQCALVSERMDHHPEWSNSYNEVHIQLTTEDVEGLSEKDFLLAEQMEVHASTID